MGFSYNPGVSYRGDALIAQAGNAISDDLRKAIDTYKQDQQQEAFSSELMHHLAQTPSDPTDPTSAPIVPIDKLNEFQNAPLKKKVGMAMAAQSTAASTAADAFKRTQLNLEKQTRDIAQQNATSEGALRGAQSKYYEAKTASEGADDETPFSHVTDENGQIVPGKIYVKKTGAIADVSGGDDAPILDPSRKFYKIRKTNEWKPVPGATLVLPGMVDQGPTGPQSPSTFNVTPGAPLANSTTAQPALQSAPVMTAADHQALAWARANPSDARSAAILKKLGIVQ